MTTFTLNNGLKFPALGLGTWLSKPGEVSHAVKYALQNGYKHIDGALIYGNEKEVGQGLKDSGVKREDIFLTSKLWNTQHKPENVRKAIKQTLGDLQTSYLDLYLIHWPSSWKYDGDNLFPKDKDDKFIIEDIPFTQTWSELEKLVDEGLVKSIGISNFSTSQFDEVYNAARIKPAVVQIEHHPYLQQEKFIKHVQSKGVIITAYSPFGNQNQNYDKGKKLDPLIKNETIVSIADKLGKTPAQVTLAWGIAKKIVVVPKSVNEKRIVENLGGDFKLESADVAAIDKLDKDLRFNSLPVPNLFQD